MSENDISNYLSGLMKSKYQLNNLCDITKEDFKKHILSSIGRVDYKKEGYTKDELEQQRDLSIKFHWGHNHDFGDFELAGRMEDRHIKLLARFCELFSLELEYFNNKNIFDIGCWTGGTSLLLAALGANVYAIEEVKKYAEMAKYLVSSFGLSDSVDVVARSLYSCNEISLHNKFDMIYFPGVIYHVSDPVLSLRILYNSCKVGGVILVESEGVDSDKSICVFEGSSIFRGGAKEEFNRGGWNWFLPSESALKNMLYSAGFEEVQSYYDSSTNRVFAYGKKIKEKGITKAGLSVQDIL